MEPFLRMSFGSSLVVIKIMAASNSTYSSATPSIPTHKRTQFLSAGDSTTNLHTALDMYKDHISELQGMTLKYVYQYKILSQSHAHIICMQWLHHSGVLVRGLRVLEQNVWTLWCKW